MTAYDNPVVTIDTVVFQLIDGAMHVLLTQRERQPFAGKWSLPGGYIFHDETSVQAVKRTMNTKAPALPFNSLGFLEQLYTFDTTAVEGGNAISIVYMALCNNQTLEGTTQFWPIKKLPDLAYEHVSIIEYALARLRNKLTYTNIAYALLPPTFTFTDLQHAYEEILDQKMDKRNFRKKFLQLDLIQPTEEYYKDGAHRPALLYKFKQQGLQSLSRSFN